MIDPKVLRIGNWIHCKGSSHYGIVTGDILAKMERDEKFREKFEYVQLTPELLEAAGYDNRHGEGDLYWLPKDRNHDLGLYNIEDGGFDLYWGKIQVRHVHHLQNIYFIVTDGSELPLPESAKIIPQAIEK